MIDAMRKCISVFLKHAIVLIGLIFLAFSSNAQKTITGKILDSKTGQGIKGVTILVKGTKSGTETVSDGSYSITVPNSSAILEISAIGYASQEVPVSDQTSLDIAMVNSAATLSDVVIIGYGTVKKKDLTGSIATISADDFQNGSITSPEQQIAGKIAGVTITSNGGQPGSGSTIRIRGGTSLNASNDPLVVIDGVPLSSVNLQGINPEDIESYTILKDAAATAIYGSRASNGVIIVTTKKGKRGKPSLSFTTQLSASHNIKEYPVLSAAQFTNLVKTYGTATQIGMLGTSNTDWQKQIYQTAITTDNNLSYSGSLKNMPFRLGGEFLNQGGILKTDNLTREALSVSLSPNLLDNHLKIQVNLHGSNTDSRTANTGAIGSAVSFDPTQSVYSNNKNFGGYFEWTTNDTTPQALSNRNPLALLEQYNAENHALRSFGNIQFDYKVHFLPDLHANLNLGYDAADYKGTTRVPADAAQSYNAIPTLRGQNNQYYNNYSNKVLEFYLNYQKDINSIKSNINAVAGYGYYDDYYHNKNFPSISASNDTIPGTAPVYPTSFSESTLESYYGRLIYTFDNKYILMGSIRTDGSSKFGPAYRWGVFPSAAFTWKVNQENFLKNSNLISTLNLRLSDGVTGNQDGIGFYNYLNYYSLSSNTNLVNFGNNFYNTYTPSAYAADLKWEQTETRDVGIDYGFLHNRISGSIDYYYKKTSNLLATVYVPDLTNFGNQLTRNVGNMTDEGVDFNINVGAIKTQNVSWDISFNASYNKFTITNLSVSQDSLAKVNSGLAVGGISGGTGNTIQEHSVGYSPFSFYVLQQVYNTDGKPIEGLYVDQNRDGIINGSDFIHYKSPFAPFTFGFSTSLTYKKWSISTVLRASVGNYMYNNAASNLAVIRNVLNPVGFLQNAPSSILNTGFYNNQFFSSYYVENASFLKMDNLGLSYNAGYLGKEKYHLSLSLNCQNVFTVTKYTGSDPEIYGGIDNVLYPRPRIFTLGANLTL
jgi:TonB-dependent starch-binding outer membrane protein SusC